LRMLAGLLRPTTGTIQFQNQSANGDHFRSLIGYLPQYPVFYSWMTGKEFLTYSGELTLMPKSKAQDIAEQLLDKAGIYDVKDKKISTYSNGMKQRLGIAQAIIHHPKLLLLDEPVASLDHPRNKDGLAFTTHLQQ